MTNVRSSAARAVAWIERLAERRLGLLVLFACALAVYAAHAFAWPLRPGRDLDDYLRYYLQILDNDPPLPVIMISRTPLTPIFDGVALDLWRGRLAEPILAVLYASSIVAWFGAARFFGPRAALAVAVILLADPAYGALFHDLSSEPVFAAGFAGFAFVLVRAVIRPSTASLAAVGAGVAVLTLVRPGNQVLAVFALLPLLMAGRLRTRLSRVAVVIVATVIPLAAWSVVNGLRYGEYAVTKGVSASFFYHSLVVDADVERTNGPATRKLIRAIDEHLLTREPYKGYGVTLEEVLSAKSLRAAEDISFLAYEVWGWDGSSPVISAAGREAARAHPGLYAKNVMRTLWQESSEPYYRYIPNDGAATKASASKKPGVADSDTVVVNGVRLPRPSDGDVIPAGQNSWIARPDHGIRVVWTSRTTNHFVFATPQLARKFREVEDGLVLFDAFPTRTGNHPLALRLNQVEHRLPRPIHWLVLGLLALAIRRPSGSLALLAPALAGAWIALVTAMAAPAELLYVLPMTPALVLLAVGAIFAPRRRGPAISPRSRVPENRS